MADEVDADVYGGLKNALERGEDIEHAMKSMLAAGYDKFEVEEAAKRILKYMSDAQLPQGLAPKPAEAKVQKSKQEKLPSPSPTSSPPQQTPSQTPSPPQQTSSPTPSPQQQTPHASDSPAPLQIPSLKPLPLPEIKIPKKKKGKKILIIIAIILLVIMQGWFVYFLIKKFI